MSVLSTRIRLRREELGMSQEELASRMGYRSKSSITKIEKGSTTSPRTSWRILPPPWRTSTAWLLGLENGGGVIPEGFEAMPRMARVPLVGSIACGTPITAEQNIERYIGVPAGWHADFALTCHGDSMAPTIQDGDIVCIRRQPEVEQGEIAAVRIGEEATLKHFHRQGDAVVLLADNAAVCPPIDLCGAPAGGICRSKAGPWACAAACKEAPYGTANVLPCTLSPTSRATLPKNLESPARAAWWMPCGPGGVRTALPGPQRPAGHRAVQPYLAAVAVHPGHAGRLVPHRPAAPGWAAIPAWASLPPARPSGPTPSGCPASGWKGWSRTPPWPGPALSAGPTCWTAPPSTTSNPISPLRTAILDAAEGYTARRGATIWKCAVPTHCARP